MEIKISAVFILLPVRTSSDHNVGHAESSSSSSDIRSAPPRAPKRGREPESELEPSSSSAPPPKRAKTG